MAFLSRLRAGARGFAPAALVRHGRGFLVAAALLLGALLLSSCAPTQQLGPRPGQTPLDAAEIYLQRYQPGTNPRVFQTTRIFDRNGTLIGELWSEGRRSWLPLNRFSKQLINATIAAEDSTFYNNTGVDTARVYRCGAEELRGRRDRFRRLDHHDAACPQPLPGARPALRAVDGPEDARGGPGAGADRALHQGRNPRDVPEPGELRPPRVRA